MKLSPVVLFLSIITSTPSGKGKTICYFVFFSHEGNLMFFRQDSGTNDELFCSISRSICHARPELESETGSSSISHVTALKLPSRTEVKNKRFQMKTYPPVFLKIFDMDCLVQVFPSNDK